MAVTATGRSCARGEFHRCRLGGRIERYKRFSTAVGGVYNIRSEPCEQTSADHVVPWPRLREGTGNRSGTEQRALLTHAAAHLQARRLEIFSDQGLGAAQTGGTECGIAAHRQYTAQISAAGILGDKPARTAILATATARSPGKDCFRPCCYRGERGAARLLIGEAAQTGLGAGFHACALHLWSRPPRRVRWQSSSSRVRVRARRPPKNTSSSGADRPWPCSSAIPERKPQAIAGEDGGTTLAQLTVV